MYLQKVCCTVLCVGMLRNVWSCIFNELSFTFFWSLGDFTRRPSTAYRLCPFVFWNFTQGRMDPRFQLGQVLSSLLCQGSSGQLGGELPNSICISQMSSHQTRFLATCIRPFCFQLSWTTWETTPWAFGTCAFHSGKGTRTRDRWVSKQEKPTGFYLFWLLIYDLCWIGRGKGSREGFYIF